jgi:hypothetical protein
LEQRVEMMKVELQWVVVVGLQDRLREEEVVEEVLHPLMLGQEVEEVVQYEKVFVEFDEMEWKVVFDPE